MGQLHYFVELHSAKAATQNFLSLPPVPDPPAESTRPTRSTQRSPPGTTAAASDSGFCLACHHTSFLSKFDLLSKAKDGGNFVVNCPWKSVEELDAHFPARLRRSIAEKKMNLYTIDAHAVAVSVELPPSRINQVMQSTFFDLSQVLPKHEALQQLEAAVDRMYDAKHPKIVTSNKAALHAAPQNLNKVEYPESWGSAFDTEVSLKNANPSRT